MERLTERCDYGWVCIVAKQVTTHCGDFPCKDVGGCERSKDRTCPWLKTIDRLAAYEDTGLEPEDMKRVFSEDAILKLAGQALGTTAEHLRNLLSIEKAGRLVVAKYEIGTILYQLQHGEKFERKIIDGVEYQRKVPDDYIIRKRYNFEDAIVDAAHPEKLDTRYGKYYLTREEAETALGKEREHD